MPSTPRDDTSALTADTSTLLFLGTDTSISASPSCDVAARQYHLHHGAAAARFHVEPFDIAAQVSRDLHFIAVPAAHVDGSRHVGDHDFAVGVGRDLAFDGAAAGHRRNRQRAGDQQKAA